MAKEKKVTPFYKNIVPTRLKNGTDVRVEPVRLGNRTYRFWTGSRVRKKDSNDGN